MRVKIFPASVATTQFFKDYLKEEGKAEKQLNCSRTHQLHGKIHQIDIISQ
jgi:hypothetical protein